MFQVERKREERGERVREGKEGEVEKKRYAPRNWGGREGMMEGWE